MKNIDLAPKLSFQRKQYIKNSNDIKYLLEIDCGVPQELILGPLLFLIYEWLLPRI